MKVIYNNIIPFKGFVAMTLYPFIFVRKEYADIFTRTDERHESIHGAQQLETMWFGFLLWYIIEWLVRVVFTHDCFSHKAYRNISFEREAYEHQHEENYLEKRKHFSWLFR